MIFMGATQPPHGAASVSQSSTFEMRQVGVQYEQSSSVDISMGEWWLIGVVVALKKTHSTGFMACELP